MKNQLMSLFQFYSYIDWISTCFGPTGPSSGELTQLFPQQLVQYPYRSGRVFCMLNTEHATRTVRILNQWLWEQLCKFS